MYKISVILPIYNVEKYLRQCVESVVNQTIGFENIELIMVDDCSSDSSYQIAQEYAKKYKNCISIRLDERSGAAGKPRNEGIKIATGKYLMFSDPDDFFSLDAFEKMYNAIEKKKADFIIANWNYADEDGTPWERPVFDPNRFKSFKLDIHDYGDSFYIMNSSMCNKIFNRDFVISNNIFCLENVPGEDTYFSMNAFLNAKNVFYIDDIIYYYRQRNLADTKSVSFNCSYEFFKGMNYSYKKLYELFDEKKELKFYRFVYARNMTYLLYRFIDSTLLTDDERVELLGETRWFYKLSKTLKVPAVQKSLYILIDKIIAGEYKDVIEESKIIAEIRSYLPKDIKQSMSKPDDKMYKEIKLNLPDEVIDELEKPTEPAKQIKLKLNEGE